MLVENFKQKSRKSHVQKLAFSVLKIVIKKNQNWRNKSAIFIVKQFAKQCVSFLPYKTLNVYCNIRLTVFKQKHFCVLNFHKLFELNFINFLCIVIGWYLLVAKNKLSNLKKCMEKAFHYLSLIIFVFFNYDKRKMV